MGQNDGFSHSPTYIFDFRFIAFFLIKIVFPLHYQLLDNAYQMTKMRKSSCLWYNVKGTQDIFKYPQEIRVLKYRRHKYDTI